MTVYLDTSLQRIGFLALAFAVFFVAALAGAGFLLAAAFAVGISAPLFAGSFGANHQDQKWWLPPLCFMVVLLASLGIVALIRPVRPAEWFIALVLFAAMPASNMAVRMTRRRCALCRRRLGPHLITFSCPRCGLEVCDDICWDFERRRCRLCAENHVPLLPSQSQWWDRQLGSASHQGRCHLCMALPEEAELRCCAHCHRPQCRDCWDQMNGECGRCGWVIPELPDSLRAIAVHLPAHMEN